MLHAAGILNAFPVQSNLKGSEMSNYMKAKDSEKELLKSSSKSNLYKYCCSKASCPPLQFTTDDFLLFLLKFFLSLRA
jgi:hypothetical protein